MHYFNMRLALLTCAPLFLAACPLVGAEQIGARRPVLMISIDGMHPSYVLEADKHALKIPVLRKFAQKGTYAERVINVSPTVTYPNHTTLVTGVLPSEHGIYSNTVFDPLQREQGAWNWYSPQVKSPTLWGAAKKQGLTTASVLWPVTVNARSIDYNVPEFWRTKKEFDHYLMETVSTPPGFLEEAEKTAGFFHSGDGDIVLDEKITKVAVQMIQKGRPHLLTVHIVSLDHVEHGSGPFSSEAKETLEQIDAMVGRMSDAFVKAHPNGVVMVVSDHGFHPVKHKVHLNAAFQKAGLITLGVGPRPQVASWKAFAWASDGSASVVLQDSKDRAVEEQVARILSDLEKDPANGINRVLRGAEAKLHHALPQASFVVDCKAGYSMGAGLTGAVVQDLASTTGSHGYLNTHPELNSAFFAVGPGILHGKNLGVVDIRQIAPTIALELGLTLPTAKMKPLAIRAAQGSDSGTR